MLMLIGAGCARGALPTAASEPATQVLDAAVNAVGGRERILGAHTLIVEGEGRGFILGQGPTLENMTLSYRITELRRAVDFTNGRWQLSQVITPEWKAQSTEPSKQTMGLDGGIGFDVGDDGAAARASDAVARDRRTELRQSPLGILQLALAPGTAVTNLRRDGGREVIDVRAPDGQALALTIDSTTRLPVKVASMTNEDTLGDVIMETEFADYQRVDGLMLPTHVTSRLDHTAVAEIRVSNTVNAQIGNLEAPAALKAAGAGATSAPEVTAEELAPGVWRLAGGSHHSVLVELADHLMLIEAPWDDGRTLAVLARARALRPGKPLTHVVCTHHHFDHAGGVRAAVSEGLTIIAHDRNRRFLEELTARPRTIAPDALANRPRALRLETVKEQMTIDDPAHPVKLFSVDSPHADTMVVAYLPRERLLVEADLYTPAPPPLGHPNAGYLLRLVESQHLTVDRVVPLHRDVVPFAVLVAAARQ